MDYPCGKLSALEGLSRTSKGKVVVFCDFRRGIDAVEALLAKMGMNPVTLDGRQADKGVWKRFQSEPCIRAIVCQYQSGSAGIDLFAADTIVFSPSLSSNLTEQARDRIHRHRPAQAVLLLLPHNEGDHRGRDLRGAGRLRRLR